MRFRTRPCVHWSRSQADAPNRPALALYKRAHAYFPTDKQLTVEWAKLAGEQGDIDTARQLYREVTPPPPPPPWGRRAALPTYLTDLT